MIDASPCSTHLRTGRLGTTCPTKEAWMPKLIRYLTAVGLLLYVGLSTAAADSSEALADMHTLQAYLTEIDFIGIGLVLLWPLMIAGLLLGFPLGCFLTLTGPARRSRWQTITLRLLLTVLWCGLTLAFTAALLFGLLGSLGHSYGPSTSRIIEANLYAYIAFSGYLGWLLLLIVRRKRDR